MSRQRPATASAGLSAAAAATTAAAAAAAAAVAAAVPFAAVVAAAAAHSRTVATVSTKTATASTTTHLVSRVAVVADEPELRQRQAVPGLGVLGLHGRGDFETRQNASDGRLRVLACMERRLGVRGRWGGGGR